MSNSSTQSKKEIWLVEDDILIADSLRILFTQDEEFCITAHFRDGETFVKNLSNEISPDIVLMDITLPGKNGIDILKEARGISSSFEAIMLTVHDNDNLIFDSFCAGASGYLLKNTPTKRIKSSIREALNGGAPMSTLIARKVVTSFRSQNASPLSQREDDVLQLLCIGKSYKIIADELFISMDTVRAHIRNIYKKLEVNSNIEAIAKAYQNKWVN